jgi:hypothetical protein
MKSPASFPIHQAPAYDSRLLIFAGLLSLVKVLMHLPFITRYGYHLDELYFLACGQHLAFGYVDHPPFVPLVARLADLLFGGSLAGLRIFAVLAGAGAVFMTALLVLRLGGGWFAVLVSSLSMLVAPVFVRSNAMLTILAFEPIIWVSCAYFMIRMIQEERPALWIWIGVLLGVGLMIKHSTLFLMLGIGFGVLLTPLRAHLRTRWPYLAVAIAIALFLPNIVWQIRNDWPTLRFMIDLNSSTMGGISILQFVLGQFLYLNPFTAPVWIAGLVLFFRGGGAPYRPLGVLFAVVAVLLLAAKSKVYYLAPAYPMLLAGGGVVFERFASRKGRAWARPATVGLLLASFAALAPLSLPIMSVQTADRVAEIVTFGAMESSREITGDLHGMFGWEERVETVAKVFYSLSPEERDTTVIFGAGYGVAGAIDHFGGAYGLPKAVSNHLTYHYWGLPDKPITTFVFAGVPTANPQLRSLFADVSPAAETVLENVDPSDRIFSVTVCRSPRMEAHEMWAKLGR